ncbi:MAG TPA: hypothetical protein VIF64_10915 [Pyrinomonadaceae bacterium]|jgi:anti-sigma factor RsiW
MKEVNAPKCGRENDLIGFLYDELNQVEAQSFQRHISDCASCNAELAAFRNVRESVVTWRNESLGIFASAATEPVAPKVAQQKASALSAVRAFFDLAPLWMKGAVAFASVLFVLFAGLYVTRWYNGKFDSTGPQVVTSTAPGNTYSPEQINALVDQRVKEELQRIKSSKEKAAPSPSTVADNHGPRRRVLNQGNESASNQKARRPLSRTEREQLATDLRLTSEKPENEFDLFGDRINQ